VLLRVHYPLDLSPHPCPWGRVYVFGTVEHAAGLNIQSFQQEKGVVDRALWERQLPPGVQLLTPSKWSARGFLASGLPSTHIHVIPHGFNASLFHPPETAAVRRQLRVGLGWADDDDEEEEEREEEEEEDEEEQDEEEGGRGGREGSRDGDGCVVAISVGHMRWLKGADILLAGAVETASSLPPGACLRMVLKGQDSLYGSTGELSGLLDKLTVSPSGAPLRELVDSLAAQGKLYLDVIGSDLSGERLGEMLRAADVYVSPYRAEGFNLPVLEAAASGLPLVVSSGGATDEFTHTSFALYIETEGRSGEDGSFYLEPKVGAFTSALRRAVVDARWRKRAGKAAAQWVRDNGYEWQDIAQNHLELFFPNEYGI